MKRNIKRSLSKLLSVSLAAILGLSYLSSDVLAADDSPVSKPIVVVSLGDSFSSGEANPPFGYKTELKDKVNDEDWLAHRSNKSWSGQLQVSDLADSAKTYTLNDYRVTSYDPGKPVNWFFSAVSGAETHHMSEYLQLMSKDFFVEPQTLHGQRKPYNKSEIIDGELINYNGEKDLPYQLSVFDDNNLYGKVDYVTITIGGNDAGFAKIIEKAVATFGKIHIGDVSLEGQLKKAVKNWNKENTGIRARLKETYREILEKAGSQVYIIVAGYPQLFYESDGAIFSAEECRMINDVTDDFNRWISELVTECDNEFCNGTGHIVFADVEKAFDERGRNGVGLHGMYDPKKPFLNDIKLSASSEDLDQFSLFSAYSAHPNEGGIESYRDCVQNCIYNIEAKKRRVQNPGDISKYKIKDIASGDNTYGFITEDGELYCWGDNSYGKVKFVWDDREGLDNSPILEPTKIDIKEKVTVFVCGKVGSACITEDGKLYSWGGSFILGREYSHEPTYYSSDEASYKNFKYNSTPGIVMENVKAVSVGSYHMGCITKNGDLYMWGENTYGQLGTKDTKAYETPQFIMPNVRQLLLGNDTSACVTEDNKLYVWGNGNALWRFVQDSIPIDDLAVVHGQKCGITYPVSIRKNVKALFSSSNQVSDSILYLDTNNDLYAIGDNSKGVLGIDPKKYFIIHTFEDPVLVHQNVKDVVFNEYGTSAFITQNGDLYTWGSNEKGALGTGINTESSYYQTYPMKMMEHVAKVRNDAHACVTEDGIMYTWGSNSYGSFGNNKTDDDPHPTPTQLKPERAITFAHLETKADNAPLVSLDAPNFMMLAPDMLYNVYAFKNNNDGLTISNLMYVTQLTSSEIGRIPFDYELKEDTDVEWLAVPFELDKKDDPAAKINVVPKFLPKEVKTYTDITLTAGGKTFTADSTGRIALTGLANGTYDVVVSKPTYAARKVTITVGAANDDVIICKYGDVTGNGEIDNEDIARMQQKISQWNVNYVYDETADLNGDGEMDTEDLARLQQYISGWNVKLGKVS